MTDTTKAPGIRERMAEAIGDAVYMPHDDNYVIDAVDRALAVVLEALVSERVVSAAEEALWDFLFNGSPSINSRTHAAKITLTAAATHLKGETDADA